jgi:hypothetical protein
MKRSVLHSSLEQIPLVIETMDKGRGTYDKRIGIAQVNLSEVLKASKTPVSALSTTGTLQVVDRWVPIVALEGNIVHSEVLNHVTDSYVRIGLVRVVLTLEDLGAMVTVQPQPQPQPTFVPAAATQSVVTIPQQAPDVLEKVLLYTFVA